MSAWILIYSYIFSLNLSRDCSIGISCPGHQSVHHLMTKWIAFAAPALRSRIFQGMSQWAARCRKCPATCMWKVWSFSTVSLCISVSSFENWYLLRAEGFFERHKPNFSVLLKISVLQRGGWFLLSMCWDLVRNRARFKQVLPESQVVKLHGLRWGVIRQKTIGSVTGMLSLRWQLVPGNSGVSYIYLDFREWDLHYCIWLE